MEPFTYPLHRTWSQEQTPQVAAPGSIAHLDDVSDGEPRGQQSHPPISQQQPFDFSASPQTAPPGTARVDGDPQEHRQLDRQFAEQLDTRNSSQTVHEAQITDKKQYNNTMQLFPSHTVNAQTSEPFSEHLHAVSLTQMPSILPPATRETEIKQELTIDDHDLFATFTNECLHHKDSQEGTENKQASHDVSGLVDQEPIPASIKSEPDIGGQVNTNLSERIDSTIRADRDTPTPHVTVPRPESLSRNDSLHYRADLSETDAFPKRVRPVTPDLHEMTSHISVSTSKYFPTDAALDDNTKTACEQWAQEPFQQSINHQASSLLERRQSSTDQAKKLQRYGSVETVPSFSNIALMSFNNNQLDRLWQQRLQLLNTDPVTAEQAHGYPHMVHGSMPTSPHFERVKGQQITGLSTFTGPSNLQPGNPSQCFSTSQPRVNTSYNGHLPHHSFSSHLPHAHPFARRIPSGHGTSLQMSTPNWLVGDAFTSVGPIDPHNTQVDEGDVEMSEQSHPLMIDQSSRDLGISADSVTSSHEDLEDPSDNDASNAEPICWKLPSFEITYHCPEKPDDNHEAIVSIPNLVRENVALTDDHHQQEMQLFLRVFLPAQRALQTPDPEPAHAVINFHTISVMVLEAFVQWEIGDELGRGYGFHGGNTAMRPPPEGKEDDEPERIRSAIDADVDEIFFAVVDRWRAGVSADKGTFKLIRGCQEFCDIALDIIHFIKEHGLLLPEPKKRKERSDKGSARGPKGGAQEDSKGKRKADAGKVNNVSSRKKPKTEGKKEKKPVAKPKKKEKATVQVVRKN